MLTILKNNRSFFFVYLLFLVLGIYILIHFNKGDFELYINQNYPLPFLDTLFYYATMLGNGWFFALVIVIALFIKFRYALLLAVTFALSGLLTQLFKRVIFPDHERPVAFFHDKYYLHLVSGVDINFQNSLVSGHTASAFACFGMLAFIARNKHRGPLLCFIAILVGFSRVYLMQHFFEDVFYGSMVGVLSSFFVYYFIQKNQALGSKMWMDKSLLHVMKLKK